MADDPFQLDPNETVSEPPKFEELVGEGKKYADQQAVAKAVYEKDRYIAQILREQKEMREALGKRISEEEFLTKLEQVTTRKLPEVQDIPVSEGTRDATAVTPATVEQIIAQREAEVARKNNVNSVLNKLQEVYGDDYKRHVQKQAQSMGVGTDFLTDIASKNPQAFYKIMGLDVAPKQESFSAPPRSAVQTQQNTQSKGKTYADFKKLREEKGEAAYFNASVQNEMWSRIKEIGEDAFYGRPT